MNGIYKRTIIVYKIHILCIPCPQSLNKFEYRTLFIPDTIRNHKNNKMILNKSKTRCDYIHHISIMENTQTILTAHLAFTQNIAESVYSLRLLLNPIKCEFISNRYIHHIKV